MENIIEVKNLTKRFKEKRFIYNSILSIHFIN